MRKGRSQGKHAGHKDRSVMYVENGHECEQKEDVQRQLISRLQESHDKTCEKAEAKKSMTAEQTAESSTWRMDTGVNQKKTYKGNSMRD